MTDKVKNLISEMIDDKFFVVLGVVILGIGALIQLKDPSSVLQSIITGLFGIAVGRKTS